VKQATATSKTHNRPAQATPAGAFKFTCALVGLLSYPWHLPVIKG